MRILTNLKCISKFKTIRPSESSAQLFSDGLKPP
jgi:hypothetical protein